VKKRFLSCLFAFLFLLSGCRAEKGNEKKEPITPLRGEFGVDVVLDQFQTSGKISVLENGSYRFEHTDPTSPLFGMQEIWDDEILHVSYRGIVWETQEIRPITLSIFEILSMMEDPKNLTEEVKLGEEKQKKFTFSSDKDQISLILEQNTKEPIMIQGSIRGCQCEIRFSK